MAELDPTGRFELVDKDLSNVAGLQADGFHRIGALFPTELHGGQGIFRRIMGGPAVADDFQAGQHRRQEEKERQKNGEGEFHGKGRAGAQE
jgi:hypothetical protein